MTELKDLHFFATPEHNCSYIQGYKAKTLFVDPHSSISVNAFSQLSNLGFRRSGKHIYRPHCDNCQACISVRVPVNLFKPNKTQRRIFNKNKDLVVKRTTPHYTDEYFQLYSDYISQRHADGDMHPPNKEQFINFLIEGDQPCDFLEFYLDEKLIAVAVTDQLVQGLSATYTFYDPDPAFNQRSLGTYAILWQIEECRRLNLEYLYMGYWVQSCRKMKYKIAYRPLEFLIDGQWILIR
ncbi:arginyltransferase [Neptunomonas sp.]|uniref:arginyltransferase n=1 Tax=Neptunomonas sp. TaxID=1971898 RepID=UPI003567D6F9